MALAATGVFEVRTTGSDTQSGYFNPASAGVDYSQQDAAQLSLTDVVTNSTTTVTSATGGFTTQMVGSGINIAGTVYEITARTDTNTITVDRATGTGSGQTGKVGGACASPGYVAGQMVAGNDVWIKSGTYLITSTTANISGGRINLVVGAASGNLSFWQGYQTTRGDLGTKPIIRASGISTTILLGYSASGVVFLNFDIDGASLTSIRGVENTDNGPRIRLERCKIRNCTNGGVFVGLAGMICFLCEVTGCSSAQWGMRLPSSEDSFAYGCYVHDNTVTGFGNGGVFINCIAANNTGSGVSGFADVVRAVNCLAYGNANNGFSFAGGDSLTEIATYINCLAVNNGGWGFTQDQQANHTLAIVNCGAYNNTSGTYNSSNILRSPENFITLTADPFVNAAGGNFALNNTAGGGAALRGLGIPGSWAVAGLPNTTGYPDIGAVQAQSASLGNKTPYNLAAKEIMEGTLGGVADSTLANSTLKIMLVTSGYVPDADHTVVDNGANNSTDPSFNEISVTGYTPGWGASGRQTVGGKSFSANDTSDRGILDATDPVWTSLGAGATIAGAILIKEGVANDTTSRLIAYYALTPYITEGVGLRLQLDTSGLLLY